MGNNPQYGPDGVVTTGGGVGVDKPQPSPIPPTAPPVPIANFTYQVLANNVVQFTNTTVGQASSYVWDFGDGTITSNVTNPVHKYSAGGYYYVTLTAKNANGSTQQQIQIHIASTPVPQASFTVNASGLAVQVTNTSNFVPTGTSWNFGDGESGNGNNTVHIYSAAGTYTITMTSNGLITTNPVTVSAPTGSNSLSPILWTELSYAATQISLGIPNNLFVSNYPSPPGSNIGSAISFQSILKSVSGVGIVGGLFGGGTSGAGSVYFGLSESDPGKNPNLINFGVQQNGTNLYVIELGTVKYTYSTWVSGTNYVSITINGSGQIQYYVGSFTFDGSGNITGLGTPSVIYTETGTLPSFPLIAVAIVSEGKHFSLGIPTGVYDALISGVQLTDPPSASFSYTPVTGTPEEINFTDTSSGSPTSWLWNFGDGGTSTIVNPTHTYTTSSANPGTYTYNVSLTVSNALGTNTIYQTVAVIVPSVTPSTSIFPPIASFTCTLFGTNPLVEGFTDTSTNNPTAWVWTDNGVQFSTSHNPTGHSMATGTHIIQLTVSDSLGRSSTATASVVVAASDSNPADSAPGVDIASTVYSGVAPVSVTLSATVSTPVTYSWVSSDGQNSTASSPTFVYKIPGTYTITLTATDTNGSTTATIQIYVASTISIVFGDEYTYAIDNPNDRVLMYNFSGVPEGSFGTSGANAGQLNNPTKLDVVKIFEEF